MTDNYDNVPVDKYLFQEGKRGTTATTGVFRTFKYPEI